VARCDTHITNSQCDLIAVTMALVYFDVWVGIKASHTRYRALGPELIPVYRHSARRWLTISHPPGGRLPLLSARPAVTFPAAPSRRASPPLAGTKLYCLVTEVHMCEQLAQGCYAAFAPSRIWNHDLLITSPTLYPLRRCATAESLDCAIHF